MICDFATQKPVSAHGGLIGTILGLVFHVTAGEGDPFNEFANPANQVSSHFGILNGQGGTVDGALEQYVDTEFDSWAQMAGNSSYLSCETEGQPGEALTPAQVTTFGRLMAWAHAEHGIPLAIVDVPGQRGLILHSDGGAAWGGHPCPGPLRASQRTAILAAASKLLDPTPEGATVSDFPNAVAVCQTASGKGAWVVGSDGGVFTTGDAQFLGSLGGKGVTDIVGIARSWTGAGYYLWGADGGVFAFGDAANAVHGSYPGLPANERQGDRTFGGGSFQLHWGGTGYTLTALDGNGYGFGA